MRKFLIHFTHRIAYKHLYNIYIVKRKIFLTKWNSEAEIIRGTITDVREIRSQSALLYFYLIIYKCFLANKYLPIIT